MDLWESWCGKFAKSGFFSPGSKPTLSFTTRDTASFICKKYPSPFYVLKVSEPIVCCMLKV